MTQSLIEPGSRAPAFELPDQNGRTHRLSEYRGQKVVLYFYPQDDTQGCTIEAQEFRDAAADIRRAGAVVLGISPDSSESHCRFADKYDLNFTLLADVPGKSGVPKVCDRYGVWTLKQMFGRTYMGIVRTTYIIGASGQVEHRFDRVRVKGHAAQVLAALRGEPAPRPAPRAKR